MINVLRWAGMEDSLQLQNYRNLFHAADIFHYVKFMQCKSKNKRTVKQLKVKQIVQVSESRR